MFLACTSKLFQSLPVTQFHSCYHIFKYLLQQHPTLDTKICMSHVSPTETEPIGCVRVYISYKELITPCTMRWEVPRSAVSKLKTQDSWWCSCPKPAGSRPKEGQESGLSLTGGKDQCPSSRQSGKRSSAFLFYSGLQLIGWGPLTWGRAIAVLTLLTQMLISCKNTLTDTSCDQMPGHPMALSSWHKSNHHHGL